MDYFVIQGGRPLNGTLRVKAAKNAVLPILAGSILARKGKTVLHNIPNIADIHSMLAVLSHLGADVNFDTERGTVEISAEKINCYEAPYDLVRKMRASFLVAGPLLARFGKARVSQPGGCAIGERPIDQHIKGFKKLGADVYDDHGYTVAEAERLIGNTIFFDRPTHTGTENLIMAAVFAEGTTTIINCAQDPEVEDLANFLNKMGAKISGAGTSQIRIDGVSELNAVEYTPIGDRLEAGTYLFAVASAGGHIKVEGVSPNHLVAPILKLEEMGVLVESGTDWIEIQFSGKPKPTNIITEPYPGFPTDLQPMAMATLTTATGTSLIWERVFERRFLHVMELMRLGADIAILGDKATIKGVDSLEGAEVMASDIRAGAGLVVAALGAKGVSKVRRVYHIDRGYERIEKKLRSLGAGITRRSY